MADNSTMGGTDLIRSVEKGGTGGPKTQAFLVDMGGGGDEVLWTAGQKAMAVSMPVAIASDQSALPVTGTFFLSTQPVSAASLPLPSGASTESTLSSLNGKVTACNTGAVVVSTMPNVVVATMPSVVISSLPSVVISSMPNVVVSTMPNVTVAALPATPAGTNLIGQVSSGAQVDFYSGATLLTKGYAAISIGSAGSPVVVAGVTGKKIVVMSYGGVMGAAGTVMFQSHNSGGTLTALSGAMPLLANQPLPGGTHEDGGLFATLAGEDLVVTTTGAVFGRLTYCLV